MKGFTYIIFAILISSFAGCINSFGPEEIQNLHSPLKFALKKIGSYDLIGSINGVYAFGKYVYALSSQESLYIIDVSEPSSPSLIKTLQLPEYGEDLFGDGNLLFIANGWGGLRIIDISNPIFSREIGYCDTIGYINGVYVSSGYAYAITSGKMWVINISNPSSPEAIAKCEIDTGYPTSIYVFNNYAYIADYSGGLCIIDVSNPHHPQKVVQYPTNDFAEDVFVSGDYAYVAVNGDGLYIIDIFNPLSPFLESKFKSSFYVRKVFVNNNYAYTVDYRTGLHIINVTKPWSPKEISIYETHTGTNSIYIANNYGYLGTDKGLVILDLFIPADE